MATCLATTIPEYPGWQKLSSSQHCLSRKMSLGCFHLAENIESCMCIDMYIPFALEFLRCLYFRCFNFFETHFVTSNLPYVSVGLTKRWDQTLGKAHTKSSTGRPSIPRSAAKAWTDAKDDRSNLQLTPCRELGLHGENAAKIVWNPGKMSGNLGLVCKGSFLTVSRSKCFLNRGKTW